MSHGSSSLPALLVLCLLFACKMPDGKPTSEHAFTNELIHESSPYLLQHAYNPVNWRPWGEEALRLAQAENKLLIVSIGYAACHWCHVMEHESFEDSTVAKFMNEHFITIKVDREERPDVDDVYMAACQLASQDGCGWPLNAFALPNGQPVWAGTYFPKKQWLETLAYFQQEWAENPQRMEEYAANLTADLARSDRLPVPTGKAEFTRQALDGIAENFLQRIDFQRGGRQGAPKFPMPSNYQFLLQYHHLSEDPRSLQAVTATLDAMADGGIYDHLGGGFARYSTDDQWLVPHFEKMLYDNAQLVSLYSAAYQVTKNERYRQVVEETLAYIEREMTSPEGAFFSSLDADSEGQEGKFYVWEKSVVDSILGPELAPAMCAFFEISEPGNWEDGKNILHRKRPAGEVAANLGMSEQALNSLVAKGKAKLFAARSTRVRPGLDDKALTSWNALMLRGYVDAYRAFSAGAGGKPEYLEAALRNGNFILEKMLCPDGGLNRNFKNGKSVINAFLDDYALSIDAFIALYQVTFDEKWLDHARHLASYAIEHFADEESGLFFYTSDLDPPLVARRMETADNVVPGSNSMMALGLHRLGLFFYDHAWLERSRNLMHRLSPTVTTTQEPDFFSNWCQLYLDFVRPPYEVAIVGQDFEKKRNELMLNYLPHAILLGGKDEGSLELLQGKLLEGETMIYVCRNKVCKLPVSEVSRALQLLEN